MSWVGADEYASRGPDPIARFAEAIRNHLDKDHADVLLEYAKAYAGLNDATTARTAGVDRYGVTLWVTTPAAAARQGSRSTSRRRPSTRSARRP